MLTRDWTPKIADFGLVNQIDAAVLTLQQGTPLYMAPEVYKSKYTNKIDIYRFAAS